MAKAQDLNSSGSRRLSATRVTSARVTRRQPASYIIVLLLGLILGEGVGVSRAFETFPTSFQLNVNRRHLTVSSSRLYYREKKPAISSDPNRKRRRLTGRSPKAIIPNDEDSDSLDGADMDLVPITYSVSSSPVVTEQRQPRSLPALIDGVSPMDIPFYCELRDGGYCASEIGEKVTEKRSINDSFMTATSHSFQPSISSISSISSMYSVSPVSSISSVPSISSISSEDLVAASHKDAVKSNVRQNDCSASDLLDELVVRRSSTFGITTEQPFVKKMIEIMLLMVDSIHHLNTGQSYDYQPTISVESFSTVDYRPTPKQVLLSSSQAVIVLTLVQTIMLLMLIGSYLSSVHRVNFLSMELASSSTGAYW